MIGVDEARRMAEEQLHSRGSRWATTGTPPPSDGGGPLLSFGLRPPREREVLADQRVAEAWAGEWARADLPAGTTVEWETRSWRSIGRQRVPVRVVLSDAEAVARFVGGSAGRQWQLYAARVARLRATLGASAALDAALRRHHSELVAWDDKRFDQVLAAARWLLDSPVRGLRPRQLPLRGVDSKWFGRHQRVLKDLHAAVTGSTDLGIVSANPLIRLRILDPGLSLGGVTDLAAPAGQLVRLGGQPDVVFIMENLECVLAMPTWPGAAVVHGDGYSVPATAHLPWVRSARVVYWGDLDSHGFAILDRLRHHVPGAQSVLMDVETLLTHRDLWVSEPKPSRAQLSLLGPAELTALERLRSEGDVRLEQERIPWTTALEALAAAAGEPEAGHTT